MATERSSGAPGASDGVCSGRPVDIYQLHLSELRAYARQIGVPESYDRASLIAHIRNRHRDDDGPDYDPDDPATYYDYNFNYRGP